MPGMLRCWACLPMAHCLFISSTLPLCAMAWIVFTCLHNDLQSSMWIEKDEGSKGDLISSKTWIMYALAVAFLQQGGTSTTWQRCKACIAFCVQQSLVLLSKTLFQASSRFHTFSVSAVFCSCWKVDGSLLSQREGIIPGAKPTMVLSAHCAFQGFANWRFFDGFWHCFQTYFLLLESAFTFFVELGVKSLRTGGCFDSPQGREDSQFRGLRHMEDTGKPTSGLHTFCKRHIPQTNGTNGGAWWCGGSSITLCLHVLAHFAWWSWFAAFGSAVAM